jgi:hypothetical protein
MNFLHNEMGIWQLLRLRSWGENKCFAVEKRRQYITSSTIAGQVREKALRWSRRSGIQEIRQAIPMATGQEREEVKLGGTGMRSVLED